MIGQKAYELLMSVSTCFNIALGHTAISIKVVPEKSGKVEYEREKLAGSDD